MTAKSTDILVLGSGIAGLSFALRAAEFANVTIITKKELAESNTNYAQGGIAAVQGRHDTFQAHVRDTLRAGAGLCDRKAVDVLVREGPAAIKFLLKQGVGFTRSGEVLSLTREAGHSKRRIAFVRDRTGREIEHTLVFQCRHHPRITLFEEHIGIDLVLSRTGAACGATVLDLATQKVRTISAKVTVLATGGFGQLYELTSNPKIATGDGIAMAFRAGAAVQDLEFMQFHPTTFNKKGFPHFLLSETMRGEGAKLINARGIRFMKRYHRDGELAPRDVVSRAITQEMLRGVVYLDVRHLGEAYLKDRFPGIYEQLWWYGVKMDRDLIPVSPAAHYSCGGIRTDTYGRTSVPNLYAFGEVAGTGVHGANRLASNSLLESVVFAKRAAVAIKKAMPHSVSQSQHRASRARRAAPPAVQRRIRLLRAKLRRTMWQDVGIVRSGTNLSKAFDVCDRILTEARALRENYLTTATVELENLALLGWLTTFSAVLRCESRGGHFRSDFPESVAAWQKHIVLQLQDEKEITVSLQ